MTTDEFIKEKIKNGHLTINADQGLIYSNWQAAGTSGMIYRPRLLTPKPNKRTNQLKTTLSFEGKIKYVSLARIIYLSVYEIIPIKHRIKFKDGDKTNIKIDNLYVGR